MSILADLFLHIATDVHPLVQVHVLLVREIADEAFDADAERAQFYLSQDVVFVKATVQAPDVFNPE